MRAIMAISTEKGIDGGRGDLSLTSITEFSPNTASESSFSGNGLLAEIGCVLACNRPHGTERKHQLRRSGTAEARG